ncbi:hypothetical protein [Rhizobium sp. WYCCWR 11128]|uniref:hypothetical protein n=1 Tax=Rhizobium sp. WYCCWR 11128 TaxID=2749832 RepID=UPI0015D438DF|nr:hypothetical protein [Rhizobium sp. WYCCWR 11128]NYT29678.1 hypothetical protein [Rhizobium sp. WYCCWR 11128]
MMKAKLETEVSKYMSYVLRHAPDAARMFSEGHSFFVSDNGVWLAESVPVQYLSRNAGTP